MNKLRMKKLLGSTMAVGLSIVGLAACGSSASKISATTVSATSGSSGATGSGGTSSGGTSSGGGAASGGPATVDGFCKDVQDYATKVKAAIANPESVDQPSLDALGQKLGDEGKQLMTANPNQIAKLAQCASAIEAAFGTAIP